jgi:hypothetical protein
MTSENPSSEAVPPGGKPRRRPPTIDLSAIEIEQRPVVDAASPSPEPAATPGEVPPQTAADPPDTSAEPPGASSAPPPNPGPRRPSIAWLPPGIPWPTIGAGAAGAAVVLIVLGVASLVTGRPGVDPLAGRLARLEQQVRELAARSPPTGIDAKAIEELADRLAKLEAGVASPRPAPLDPALANRISAIEGQVKALAETVGILGRRSDEAVATAREARQRAEATAAALAELAQKVVQPGPAVEHSEFEALANRVNELAKRPPGEGSDRAGRLALAAAALAGAVERGGPFAAELVTVKSLAADPKAIAPLEPFASSGLPAAATLARELAALLPALQQAAGVPTRDGGFLDKLAANAEKLVRVRPVEEVAGSDAAAFVARVEVKAARGDVGGALAELSTLPPQVRAPAEAWMKKVETRAAALDASRRLASDALAGLAK